MFTPIGLSVVRSLIELHGGRVEARSEGRGKGSEFIVRLPLADTQVSASADSPDSETAPVVSHRLLVVDDNPDVADSLALLLTALGSIVQTVYDGPSALAAFTTFKPDAVLLDLGLPGMDGYEIARRIRNSPGGQDVRLIALTGWGQEEERRRTRQAGFDLHLVKPVDFQELNTLLGPLVRH